MWSIRCRSCLRNDAPEERPCYSIPVYFTQTHRLRIGIVLAFFILGFLLFGSVIRSEFVSWDDKYLIVENSHISSLSAENIGHVFTSYDPELYVPLTMLSFQAEHQLFGQSSAVIHTTNLVLHILNALLVSLLLFLILKNPWLSVLLGLVFLVHPLNVEAFAWASARKDVLSTFFFLLAATTYLRCKDVSKKREYWLSVVFFLLALLSKVMALTLPVLLLLFDWMQGRSIGRQSIVEKWPYWILSVFFGIVALFGKTETLESTGPVQKILMAGRSTIFYLQKFFFPTDLSVVYPYTGVIDISAYFVAPLLLCVVLLAVAFWLRARLPLVTAGVLWFFLALIPTFTNFAKGGDVYIASDRYAYIPMIGLLIAIGGVVLRFMERAQYHRRETVTFGTVAVFVGVTGTLAVLAAGQVRIWQDSVTLYAHALRIDRNGRAIQNNMGMEYLAAGRAREAAQYFDAAQEIRYDPRTRANRAAALVQLGNTAEAKKEFEASLIDDATNKDAYYGLGNIALREGRTADAIKHYRDALAIDPLYGNALNNLGAVYMQMGDWSNAISVYETLLSLTPDFPEALYNLGGAYREVEMYEEARASLELSLELRPGNTDAMAALASVLFELGERDAAAELLKQVLKTDPENAMALSVVEKLVKQAGASPRASP